MSVSLIFFRATQGEWKKLKRNVQAERKRKDLLKSQKINNNRKRERSGRKTTRKEKEKENYNESTDLKRERYRMIK